MDQKDQINETGRMNQIDQRESPRHPNPTPTPKSHQSPHINTQTDQINQKDQKDETDQTNQTDQIDQTDKINTKGAIQ